MRSHQLGTSTSKKRKSFFSQMKDGVNCLPQARALRCIKIGILVTVFGVYSVFMFSASAAREPQLQAAKLTTEQAEKLFIEKIQPAFEDKCVGCHNATSPISNFNLETREGMLKGGRRGPSIVSGDAAKSLVFATVEGNRALDMPPMPPGKSNRLADDLVQAFRQWIDAGAPWTEKKSADAKSSNDVKKPKWNYLAEDVWAFQPMKRYPVPTEGINPAQVQTPVDAFVLQKLNEKGLKPAPQADRVALLRRATFDLTGLPPTPADVDAFLNDKAVTSKAFEKVVERLLASPDYGERWGRHWLDVVRYADTGGGSNDYERPAAWRYRDYVIRSFNQDKPYDQFIIEQLAGDELDSTKPENLIATGYLRMGPWEHTGMSVEAVTRQEWLDDITHTTGTAFTGLTMNCAKCHDHKFDPIPTKDYYRLQAVFATTRFAERPAAFLPVENRSDAERVIAQLQWKVGRLEAKHNNVQEALGVKSRPVGANVGMAVDTPSAAPVLQDASPPPDAAPPRAKADAQQGLKQVDRGAGGVEAFELEKAYRRRLEYAKKGLQRFDSLAYSVTNDEAKKPLEETFVLVGGSLSSPGEKVAPGVPTAPLMSNKDAAGSTDYKVPTTATGRRLALAKWIASPSNVLTARVMVNRIWQYHFGSGLVESSNNFGKLGKRPSHPELLDWLALQFVDNKWSIKQMHRAMMLSATYQRAAQHPDIEAVRKIDSDNRLVAYISPRRMEAEELRDSMLLISGELNREAGGPGTFPEINLDLAAQPRLIQGTVAPAWEPSPTRAERNRRSIYTFQQRSLINPLVEVFNGASLNESCERRRESTVAPQVFNLFNSQFSYDTALAFANRLEGMATDRAKQIETAFRLAYQRRPSERELKQALQHVAAMTRHHNLVKPPKPSPLKPVMQSINSELTGENFQFEEESNFENYERNLHPSQVKPSTRALAELCLILFNSNEFVYIY